MAANEPCCSLRNASNPNAPEFGKGFKPEHNSGCGCGFEGQDEEIDETTTIVRNRLTRGDFLG